ncbi:uncharacterized protein LOC111630000 [Centruroides sculpturatus]|uniref:uncharacterized protein LOC111629985 n=1 Tax=Centruroides sculpturatus TaxID=218467 RepID=UPI000C6DC3D1|nr:uncharacterized protein LOC111629985 [Centruroides sculpturatus]XP_023229761.1 uncharacterized protein LOC111630000 [Centruroides sculpturatus]
MFFRKRIYGRSIKINSFELSRLVKASVAMETEALVNGRKVSPTNHVANYQSTNGNASKSEMSQNASENKEDNQTYSVETSEEGLTTLGDLSGKSQIDLTPYRFVSLWFELLLIDGSKTNVNLNLTQVHIVTFKILSVFNYIQFFLY